ncbi:MAG: NAD-dependent DNA ligase LigA [Candidatus Omnitrophica bacterium]|nr:NAD-dependent DNA ligase LigA [Candidatus Omnitrophota bacterium]
MDRNQAKQEIARLAREIEQHNYNYYVLDAPTISDQEYDALMHRLLALEQKYPELTLPYSPTRRVGVKVPSGVRTVRHELKMLSLDNTYSADELRDWYARVTSRLGVDRVECVAELKIDGVSASLLYEAGVLTVGATRGDGEVGEDVTHNIRAMRMVPLFCGADSGGAPRLLEARGEVYMDRADFDRINLIRRESGSEVFANPRNAASGSLKLLDPAESSKRNLRFFVHSCGRLEGAGQIKTHWDFLQLARRLGFAVNPHNRLCSSFDALREACRELEALRPTLSYDVDGVVVKVNRLDWQSELGETMKSPRWAVAYKFQAYQATTRVNDIVVQVGRTGVLTPVAELEPVPCGGVVISRATLHNFDEIDRLGLHKGDRVLLERAGDVIPKIVKVVEPGGDRRELRRLPTNCPSCREDFICRDGEAVQYRCVNPDCPRQLERRLLHFASRNAMDIVGMGEAVVRQLIDRGLARSVADIYDLTTEHLLELDFFAAKKVEALLEAIEASKGRSLSRLVLGLGIPNIGEKAAALLAREFRTMDGIVSAGPEALMAVPEIGEVSSEAVVRFFAQPETRKLLERLKKSGVRMDEPDVPLAQGRLTGQVFVFTGELANRTRAQAAQLVKSLGGEVSATVTARTNWVVAGQAPGSKVARASKLGIRIIEEKEFEEMLHDVIG